MQYFQDDFYVDIVCTFVFLRLQMIALKDA